MILLADANILFDFGWVEGGLAALTTLGPLEVLENVRDEIKEADVLAALMALDVMFVPLQDSWTADLLAAKRGGLSLPDASCLHYARLAGRTVLTSERRLRQRCQQVGVDVHGSLWVVAQLSKQGTCTPEVLCQWLERWLEDGARLPEQELAETRRRLGC